MQLGKTWNSASNAQRDILRSLLCSLSCQNDTMALVCTEHDFSLLLPGQVIRNEFSCIYEELKVYIRHCNQNKRAKSKEIGTFRRRHQATCR